MSQGRIDFMVIAPPRCATTWIANWLTTDRSICYHDPLLTMTPEEIDRKLSDESKVVGIACTSVALFPDWVNAHPARKLVLTRPIQEIDASLARVGLPPCAETYYNALSRINQPHWPWKMVFGLYSAGDFYRWLTAGEMDVQRWRLLTEMYMAPRFDTLTLNRGSAKRLLQQMLEVANSTEEVKS